MHTKAIYPQSNKDLAEKTAATISERAGKFAEACHHIDCAINALAAAPQFDFCGDQQRHIEALENVLHRIGGAELVQILDDRWGTK